MEDFFESNKKANPAMRTTSHISLGRNIVDNPLTSVAPHEKSTIKSASLVFKTPPVSVSRIYTKLTPEKSHEEAHERFVPTIHYPMALRNLLTAI